MYFVEISAFDDWRIRARELLQRYIDPASVSWTDHGDEQASGDLFADQDPLDQPIVCPQPNVPRDFVELARSAACFRDQQRWALLYNIAWRLVFEDCELLDCQIDDDIARLRTMAKTVGREIHKVHAFVRFQKIETELDDGREQFVAWFEPEHPVMPLAAPFFVKRFPTMNWSILTPEACVHWNGEAMTLSNGVPRPPSIDEPLEALWCTYYASIFNPARVKLKAMQAEMPKKYWKNLPEARLIAPLTRSAFARASVMEAHAEGPWQKTQSSRAVNAAQANIRERAKSADNIKKPQ